MGDRTEHDTTDRERIDRILDGDARAAELFYRRHYRFVVAVVARAWPRFPYMHEEVAQATFLKLFDHDMKALAAWRGGPDDDVASYLAVIARNLANDYRSRPSPPTSFVDDSALDRFPGPDGEPGPELIAAAEEEARRVRDSLGLLPGRDAEVIVRLCLEEHAVGDVARDLGVTENNLYQIKARALRKLEEILRKSGFFDDRFDGGPGPV